jgi:SAM-dependent methyltransferase
MAAPRPGSGTIRRSWDHYWRGASDRAAYSRGGISHPAILAFWDGLFSEVRASDGAPRIIDIASGNGAVVECANAAFQNQLSNLTCLDISADAIKSLERRFPGICSVIADARSIPLASGTFDIVTSQFGIEYAGPEAVAEAVRLVGPRGRLALVLHHRSGLIRKDCVASLDAIEKLRASRFIPHSIRMFEAGFAACRGADRAAYDAAATLLKPAVRAVESIIVEHSGDAAGDVIAKLCHDVGTIHDRMQYYEAAEVLDWLSGMDAELQAYAERMASMRDVALDCESFSRLCNSLKKEGFGLLREEALAIPETELPLAWVLVAARD